MSECKNCGGDKGIHHYQTMQCPVGGREAKTNNDYMTTTFQEKIEKPVVKKNNEAAFPIRNRWDNPNNSFNLEEYGLSKREMFAMHFLQGMLANPQDFEPKGLDLVVDARQYADALLEELAK